MGLGIIIRFAATAVLSFLAGVGAFNAVYDNPLEGVELVRPERMELRDEVLVTGLVKPEAKADLSFDRSGRISRFFVKVGDFVPIGAYLTVLDRSEAELLLRQAEAELARAEAVLKNLHRGTRPEDLAVSEAKLLSVKEALREEIFQSYTKLDEAIRRYVDYLFDNPRSFMPRISAPLVDQSIKDRINDGRARVETLLNSWRETVFTIGADDDLNALAARGRETLLAARGFLADLALGVNSLTPGGGLSAATIAGYRADVASARDNVDAALTNLRSAESDFLISGREFDLKKAGARPEEVAVEEAKVKASAAALALKRHELSRHYLSAPFSGIVTRLEGEVGEFVTSANTVASLISGEPFEIEANVPEVDVAKLKIGNEVLITIDALSGKEFSGKLSAIDPAATMVEGVPTYKVTFRFDRSASEVRSGMTADVLVTVTSRPSVLALPLRAVKSGANGNNFIEIVDSATGEIKRRDVTLDIKDRRGFAQIVSGVAESESVVLRRKGE